jgi:hypothetical protein
MAVVFALTLAFTAGSAFAQQCVVGVYADTSGTEGFYTPVQGQGFNVYVVLHTEDVLNAVSYSIDIPGLNVDLFNMSTSLGPNGRGLNIPTAGGDNVGLGECAVGFGGQAVVVACYQMLFPFHPQNQRMITLGPNLDASALPQYSTCNGALKDCSVGPGLLLDSVVSSEAKSFGAVKSLYGN